MRRSDRMVTTAGDTRLTVSAYEYCPDGLAWLAIDAVESGTELSATAERLQPAIKDTMNKVQNIVMARTVAELGQIAGCMIVTVNPLLTELAIDGPKSREAIHRRSKNCVILVYATRQRSADH